jgi:hypothetical protein
VAEDRVGEFTGRGQRLVAVAELAPEEVVDGGKHLRPRAVVPLQRQPAAGLRAALPEDLHVRVAEAVDGLELVTNSEDLGRAQPFGEEIDQFALQPVRVLELVHHQGAETELLALAERLVVAQHVACEQLQVLEVERRLAALRRCVSGRKRVQ